MSVKVSASAIIASEQGIFLVEEGSFPGHFNLPGGGPKNHELIGDCVVREVKEETGFVVVTDGLVGVYQCPYTAARNNVLRFVFACTVASGEPTPTKKHPNMDYFSDDRIEELGRLGLLRNNSILPAIRAYRLKQSFDLSCLTSLPKEKRKSKK